MGIYGTLPIVVMLKTVYVAFDALQLSGAQMFIGEMLTHIEGVQQISDAETAYPKENEVWQVFVDRLGIALKLRHGRAEEAGGDRDWMDHRQLAIPTAAGVRLPRH